MALSGFQKAVNREGLGAGMLSDSVLELEGMLGFNREGGVAKAGERWEVTAEHDRTGLAKASQTPGGDLGGAEPPPQ